MSQRLLLPLLAGLLVSPAGPAWAENEPKALIEKAVKAYGGEEKLAKLKSVRVKSKGSLDIQGQSVEYISAGVVQIGEKLRYDLQFEIMGQKITVVQVFDGTKAWMKVLDQTQDLDGDLLKEMKEETYAARVGVLLPLLKDPGFTLAPLGAIKIDGKTAHGVKVSAKDHRDIEVYFDADSGLVVKTVRTTLDGANGNEVKRETFIQAFKEVDGLKYAAKILIHNDGKKLLEGEVTEYQIVDQIDPKEFAKP